MHRQTISFLLLGILAFILIGYGLFEARKLILGPIISIQTPIDGSATSSTAVIISGFANNIAFLSINDLPAYTDASGHFSETISPPPGYSVVTVAAKDRFGRYVSRSVHFTVLNYCPVTV